ncbi:hypothetical protein ACXR2W_00780 [Leucobacter sp. HY1908]
MAAAEKVAPKRPAVKKTAVKAEVLDPLPVLEGETAPRHSVVDQVFIWRDEEQGKIRIPLRFKMKILRVLIRMEKEEAASEMEQLVALLDGLNDTSTQEQLDELWLDDGMALVEAYFKEFQKFNKATPGE